MSRQGSPAIDAAEARVERPRALTEQAYALIEERIVTLQLQPGEFLSETALAEQVGLGRTPVREAVQRLASEGLVSVLPRRGIMVSLTDAREQLLVLEVRRELERLLSRLAAERATTMERQRFGEIAEGMRNSAAASDDLAFMRFDRELNMLVVDAAHNPYAARAMRVLHGHSRRFWYQHYKEAADLPLCARLHAEQADAISSGWQAAAAEALDRLIDYTVTFTRATATTDRRKR